MSEGMMMNERKSWLGAVGGWVMMRGPSASLSVGQRYLEIRMPFHEPVRFSPGLVSAHVRCMIPYLWYTVDISHTNESFPNPIVFHLWWPFGARSLENALTKWGYTSTISPNILENKADPSEYFQQTSKIGWVVTPLTPYGYIDIDGKAFSAMSLSGDIPSGKVIVQRMGNSALLVTKTGAQQLENEYTGKIGKVVTPLTPYGEIDIQGKIVSAMSLSGDIEFGEVVVQRKGETVLFVTKHPKDKM